MRGTKRTCLVCEVRFYDLIRSPILRARRPCVRFKLSRHTKRLSGEAWPDIS